MLNCHMTLRTTILITFSLLISACSHHETLESAQQNSDVRPVLVVPFQQDTLGVSTALEALLQKNNNLYIATLSDIKIKEGKQRHGGLTLQDRIIKNARANKINTLIVGRVSGPRYDKKRSLRAKTVCHNGVCWLREVSCVKNSLVMKTDIRILDYAQKKTLVETSVKLHRNWNSCADDTLDAPKLLDQQNSLSQEMTQELNKLVLKTLF